MRFDRLARRTFEQAGLPLALYEEAGSAAPVVFQHGLGGTAGQTAEAFPDDAAGHLVTLECRGHGASPLGPPDRLSIEQFASDIAAVIDELGAPVIVGGISMGAAIALRLAVHRPELVRALVLVRPAWSFENGPANMQANAEVADLLLAYDPDDARRRFEASATARQRDRVNRSWAGRMCIEAHDGPVPLWGKRADRTYVNAVESFAPFAALVLVAHLTGKANSMTAFWAMSFFWLRVVHAIVYLLAIPYIRTLVFTLGFVAVAGIFWEVVS